MEYHRLQEQGSEEDLEDTVKLLRPAGGENDQEEEIMDEHPDVRRSDQLSNMVQQDILNTSMLTREEQVIDVDHDVSIVNINPPHPKGKPTVYLVVAAAMAALGGVLFGYDIGIMSGALLQLKEEFSLSCFEQEFVVSSLLIGATIGSILGGFVIDKIGRRWAIILNSLVFIMGAIVLSASVSYPVLIIGRLIVGFAVSLSAIGECIYISEISPKERRGQLVSINELGITLGLLLAYVVNFCFIKVISGWRYMFALSAVPALCQGVGMFLLPPSPRFLVQQKHNQQAEKVLKKLRGSDHVSEELSAIQRSVSLERTYSILHLFQSVDNMRWRMGIGTALVFFQQITGQTNVVYYAPTVLENLGFEDNMSATVASLGVGIVKVITTCCCLMLVDKFGRRCFLLCGSGLMALFIIILGIITQTIPTTVINDTCQATSLSAENISLNSTLHMRHVRNTEPISGEEVGPVHSEAHPRTLFPFSHQVHRYSIGDRVEITKNTPTPFHSLEHRNTLLPVGSQHPAESIKEVTHHLKRTDLHSVSNRGQQHHSDVIPSDGVRERRNIHRSTQEGSLLGAHQGSSSQLNSRTYLNVALEDPSIVTLDEADSGTDTTSNTDEDEGSSEVHIAGSTKWSALVLLLLYVGAYSFGFGPITWLVISEIFPAGVRGRASSLTTVFNWGTNAIISLTFLDVIRKFGVSCTFLIYGGVCLVSAVFIYLAIPETKNCSLEKISEDLSSKSSIRDRCTLRCLSCDSCCVRSFSRYTPTLLITDDMIE
ncbi:solute carrier family 2, facilitated glucose transporter member 10 isoform X2 [Strongylocentrotus purpuratus]|uniref:Major facilitator superfamily (MFS) profile domain-containing protein n=1 Tax=Strongylocentrotus purpuratus TaxID=7668 RepID=A0A7M7SXW2_STRPU|nr:solute carrier family 2, facilitated glucose transporter member 10 isoform X2 [Strongylocentrotus purpuratus]